MKLRWKNGYFNIENFIQSTKKSRKIAKIIVEMVKCSWIKIFKQFSSIKSSNWLKKGWNLLFSVSLFQMFFLFPKVKLSVFVSLDSFKRFSQNSWIFGRWIFSRANRFWDRKYKIRDEDILKRTRMGLTEIEESADSVAPPPLEWRIDLTNFRFTWWMVSRDLPIWTGRFHEYVEQTRNTADYRFFVRYWFLCTRFFDELDRSI